MWSAIIRQSGSTMPMMPLEFTRPTFALALPIAWVTSSPAVHASLKHSLQCLLEEQRMECAVGKDEVLSADELLYFQAYSVDLKASSLVAVSSWTHRVQHHIRRRWNGAALSKWKAGLCLFPARQFACKMEALCLQAALRCLASDCVRSLWR